MKDDFETEPGCDPLLAAQIKKLLKEAPSFAVILNGRTALALLAYLNLGLCVRNHDTSGELVRKFMKTIFEDLSDHGLSAQLVREFMETIFEELSPQLRRLLRSFHQQQQPGGGGPAFSLAELVPSEN